MLVIIVVIRFGGGLKLSEVIYYHGKLGTSDNDYIYFLDYTELAPESYDILDSLVYRLYPTDDAEYPCEEELKRKNDPTSPRVQKLYDVIQEALTVHVRGLKFRERNAGPSIDDHMTSNGFNNQIGVDLNTGFVYGGSSIFFWYL